MYLQANVKIGAMEKRKGLFVSEKLVDRLQEEIDTLNQLAIIEQVKDDGQNEERKRRKKERKLPNLSLRSYTEMALEYFLRNHIDPRTIGEEKDVITEVRKLRNNVFSFMRVQEGTYLMPFLEEVISISEHTEKIEKQNEVIVEANKDLINLMEVFIEMMMKGMKLTNIEQEDLRDWGARTFAEKKQKDQ